MPTPSLSDDALAFVRMVEAKHARQILLAVLELAADPFPPGAKLLQATTDKFYRVRVGDYRIIYRVVGDDLQIRLIGRRADGEVYDDVRRKGL